MIRRTSWWDEDEAQNGDAKSTPADGRPPTFYYFRLFIILFARNVPHHLSELTLRLYKKYNKEIYHPVEFCCVVLILSARVYTNSRWDLAKPHLVWKTSGKFYIFWGVTRSFKFFFPLNAQTNTAGAVVSFLARSHHFIYFVDRYAF